MTFIICSLWLPQSGSPQAATPGKLYTVQFSFSGFHSAFAPFTNSILINSQVVHIAKTKTKSRWLLSSALFGSHSWTRTNDILINSQALYRLSYAGIFNFVLNHLCRLSFCRATLLPTPFPSLSFGSLRGNPSGAVPTQAMREYLIFKDIKISLNRWNASTYLSSQGVATQVFSALLSLTSVFGMGTGGSWALSALAFFRVFAPSKLNNTLYWLM